MKADIEDPAGGTDFHLNDNKSLLLETDNSKGPDCSIIRYTFTVIEKRHSYEQMNAYIIN